MQNWFAILTHSKKKTIPLVIALSKLVKKISSGNCILIFLDHMVLIDLLVEQFVQLGRYLVNTIVDHCSFNNRYHIPPPTIDGWEFSLLY